MKSSVLIILIIVGFCIVFTGMWSGIIYLLSTLSGWQELAKKYRTELMRSGYDSNVFGRMGFVNYNGVLRVACTDQGIYLAVMKVFSLGHSPILIPWNVIHDIREQHLLFQATVVFNADNTRITLPHRYLAIIRQRTSGQAQPPTIVNP